MLTKILVAGIVVNIILAAYGFMVYPLSGGLGIENILLEGLLVIVLFLYLFATLFGTKEYDRVDHWIHRQGIVFGLAAGVLAMGMVVNGSLGDTPIFGSLALESNLLFHWISIVLSACILGVLLFATTYAGRKTGQVTAGVQVGLWSALIACLMAFATVTIISYLLMGSLEQSPTNLSNFASSGEADLVAYLVKTARVAGTIFLALGLPVGAALGAAGGLAGRTLARMQRT